jgi:hypothetical protein
MTAIAYVTPLGYLICRPCLEQGSLDNTEAERIVRDQLRAVFSDSAPHNAECCDQCNQPVLTNDLA